MNVQGLTSAAEAGDSASYDTASVSPGANHLVLVFVTSTTPVLGGVPATPTITGLGLTWQQVTTLTFGSDGRRFSCFRALGAAPAAGPLTIDFGGQAQDMCAWSVLDIDDVDTTGTAGANAVGQIPTRVVTGSSLSLPLPVAPAAGSTAIGVLALDGDHAITAGAGTTEIHRRSTTQFLGKGIAIQSEQAAAGATLAWTWGGSAVAAAIVIEVKPVASGTGGDPDTSDEGLVRRFEPVMCLHESETFFPVDAKRFVERAALWSTKNPGDDNTNWTRIVAGQGLSAAPGEPGDFIGDHLGGSDELFLEIGGWTGDGGVAETEVTPPSTKNTYANHTELQTIYGDELQGSRFWYHAEVFRDDRLRKAAGMLTKTLDRLQLDHPTMLCYYFLFPDHSQGVSGDSCSGVITAAELGAHAGDWQCLTILLDGDGSGRVDRYAPKFLGLSGLRPPQVNVDGDMKYRPYQFDTELRTVMKVERWRPAAGSPTLVGGDHPQLFVSRGSHSLYPALGDVAVDPYPDDRVSRACGSHPTPGLTPPVYSDPGNPGYTTPEMVAIVAKFVTCGWPLGFLAGFAAAIIELIANSGSFAGEGLAQTPDTPDPDALPTSLAVSTVIRPATVSVPGATGRVETWRSQQNLQLDDRRYDFLVDRDTQVIWPNDDPERGFRGRWGQRVTADSIARQAGPLFADYANMFFGAVEDGFTRGFFTTDG